MSFYGLDTDVEALGDAVGTPTFGKKLQNFPLSGRRCLQS
jgi:hypothetical protein